MNIQEFNERCAKHLGIFYSSGEEGVFVEFENESMPRIFDPYYDANHRNIIVEDLGIDTRLLRNLEAPEWQSMFYPSSEEIEIEVGKTIAEAQVACIIAVLE